MVLWCKRSHALIQKQPPKVFYKKKLLLNISQILQENTCSRVSFLLKLQASGPELYQKETLAHVFSCEFCDIFKNTFFREYLWATVSVNNNE